MDDMTFFIGIDKQLVASLFGRYDEIKKAKLNEWICRVYGLGIGIDESEKAERVLMKWSDTSEFSRPSHATPLQRFYKPDKNEHCFFFLKLNTLII